MSSCDEITDGLVHVSKLSSLQHLDVSYCDKITNNGLHHLLNMPSLEAEQVKVEFAAAVTTEGFEAFKKQLRENHQKQKASSR